MKALFKKALALVLVLVMNVGVFALSASAAIDNDLPIIYLRGATEIVYDQTGKQVWPLTTSITDMLLENRSELLLALSASAVSGDWSVYGKTLAKTLNKYFYPGTLDVNGNQKNGTYIVHSAPPKQKTSNFLLGDYVFRYDPRLDPWETADEMASYINSVLAATGKKKVHLVARCMGCCFTSAYLAKYGGSKVDSATYYASAVRGSLVCGELFAGKLDFDADRLNNYANEYMGDDEISELLAAVVNVTYSLNLLGEGTAMVENIYKQLAVEVFPELLRLTYANMPSYWAMVNEDYFEEAKNFVFGSQKALYAGLIQKIDNYHENVTLRIESLLKNFSRSGMKIYVIAKYNAPFPPYLESHNVQGDCKISIEDISFGAVGADIGTRLSVDYLNAAKKRGTLDYISDDLIIDASTCLFPQSTWFIKDLDHDVFPTSVNVMIMDIIRYKRQITVDDFAKYPRYIQYNSSNDTLSAVQPAAPSGTTGEQNPMLNFIEIIKKLFAAFLNIFKILR